MFFVFNDITGTGIKYRIPVDSVNYITERESLTFSGKILVTEFVLKSGEKFTVKNTFNSELGGWNDDGWNMEVLNKV